MQCIPINAAQHWRRLDLFRNYEFFVYIFGDTGLWRNRLIT